VIGEYEKFHGVVLRDIIVQSRHAILFQPLPTLGRPVFFKINNQVGLLIKHCAKRLPPWKFTFDESVSHEMAKLADQVQVFWIALVCGENGIVTISLSEFTSIALPTTQKNRVLRLDRERRTQYRIYGSGGGLCVVRSAGIDRLLGEIGLFGCVAQEC